MMNYFKVNYAETSKQLSLERAIELDHLLDQRLCNTLDEKGITTCSSDQTLKHIFSSSYYKQPLLTEKMGEPLYHRRGVKDALTKQVKDMLRRRQVPQLNGMSSEESPEQEDQIV
jgi:hypothetical protein